MKKQTILNYGFVTCIVVLLFYIRSTADQPLQPNGWYYGQGNQTCRYDQINGFTTSKRVSNADARTQTAEFASFASRQGINIMGGVISKSAIDSLFCGGEYNGLAYQFAIDPTGQDGPTNAIFVIVGGVNVQGFDTKPVIISQSEEFFKNNMWCPPGCMSFE